METYINNYEKFKNSIVYDFNIYNGGIGDCIKFFMATLDTCIKNNERLYYKINNIAIEKYLKLKYKQMYINDDGINNLDNVTIIKPSFYYKKFGGQNNFSIDINNIFYFDDEVKINCKNLFPSDITEYISIHLRLGDKYLETDKEYINCKNDEREFSQEKLSIFIENNYNKNIFFCCDNNTFKLNLKKKYNKIIITNCDIGHTAFSNTTEKQILDAITEFYILTNSSAIYCASYSGFSRMAAKFNNIKLIS